MLRAFRYPLRPTKDQAATLDSWLVACCSLYNAALEQRRDAWRKQRVSIGLYDQQTQLTELRQADPSWSDIPARVERSALARLDRAFKAFFRRVARGESPGFPRFRSIDRYDSLDLGCRLPRIDGDRVRLPALGWVKFHKYREMRGELRHVSISRAATGDWTISFVRDLGEAPRKSAAPPDRCIGIDLGLEAFATLSNGERVANPRFFRAGADTLARRQQSLSRKRRGSSSRKRASVLVARAHAHIRNQRLDFARKLACTLFSRFDLIAHEDLAISRMVHGTLAKSIYDAAWGVFLRCLALKAEGAGKHVIAVDPRGTSQTCPQCGTVAEKTLKERQHACSSCGFTAHRDHAAALCVLGRGLRPGQLTEACNA